MDLAMLTSVVNTAVYSQGTRGNKDAVYSCLLIAMDDQGTCRASVFLTGLERCFDPSVVGVIASPDIGLAVTTTRLVIGSCQKQIHRRSKRFAMAVEAKEVADFPPIYLAIGLLGNIFTMTSYWIYVDALDLANAERGLIKEIFFSKIALKDI